MGLKPTTYYTLTDNDQRPKQQSLRKSKEVIGVDQSLMLSGAWSTKNQNINNHQVFVHFVLVKDSLNYQLELVVNVEPLYSRWFLSKRCNTWFTLIRVVPPLLPLLSPRFFIVRSKKSSDLLKNNMFLSSSPILQNRLNLPPFFYYFKFNLIFLVFIWIGLDWCLVHGPI